MLPEMVTILITLQHAGSDVSFRVAHASFSFSFTVDIDFFLEEKNRKNLSNFIRSIDDVVFLLLIFWTFLPPDQFIERTINSLFT